MNLAQFFTTSYWFTSNPGISPNNLKLILTLFLISSAFGGLMFINKFLDIKVRQKLGYLFLVTGLLGLLLVSFRFEGIYVLSARFLFLILTVVSAVWGILTLIYLIRDYPRELKRIEDYKRFSSYLPSPHKNTKNKQKHVH